MSEKNKTRCQNWTSLGKQSKSEHWFKIELQVLHIMYLKKVGPLKLSTHKKWWFLRKKMSQFFRRRIMFSRFDDKCIQFSWKLSEKQFFSPFYQWPVTSDQRPATSDHWVLQPIDFRLSWAGVEQQSFAWGEPAGPWNETVKRKSS